MDLLALCAVPKVNWNLIAREAQRPGGLARLLRGDLSEQTKQAVVAAAQIRGSALAEYRGSVEDRLSALPGDVRLTTVLDDDYPANLRVIYNLPPCLFYRGELRASDARSVAVVGTRTPTDEGVRRAEELAKQLAREGVTVLSGLARGIDGAAHRATVAAGGRTIAVLGSGITRTYPPEHGDLAEEIVRSGGAIVSQFWPTAPPSDYHFPMRNIVTSGMSQGTVVVEATGNSGARNQARRALEHGKKVFLLKELVTKEPWARAYLDRGALEVKSVEEIVGLLRSREEIEHLSGRRRQLALDLS